MPRHAPAATQPAQEMQANMPRHARAHACRTDGTEALYCPCKMAPSTGPEDFFRACYLHQYSVSDL